MADAAKSARGAFQDIKEGAGKMGEETGFSMMEARHSVMILGEEFGVKIPRALAGFIASLGPVGAAMEAAFPFMAIALAATILIEHLHKIHEEGEKLTESQVNFGTAVANAYNALDEKLLQAGIRADELNRDHLSALHKQLEIIDRQSMAELVHSFGEVSKAADLVFAELKSSWYTAGIGSEGASHALKQFKTEYDSLLAQGKDKEAADLLKGTRESAQHVLDLQRQAAGSRQHTEHFDPESQKKYAGYLAAVNGLKSAGVGFTEKEVQAQQALVQALDAQSTVQEKVAALKKLQGSNAAGSTQKTIDTESDARMKQQLETERQGAAEEQKLWEKAHQEAVQALQQSEKEKIEVTDKSSAERLAAIDAALKEENKYGLQETAFYLEQLNARIQLAKQLDDEATKQRAEAGKEQADQDLRMGELAIAAEREHQQLLDSFRRVTRQQQIDEAVKFANEENAIKAKAFSDETKALDKHDKDYENKLKAIQDKEKQLSEQHENEITAIQNRAVLERNKTILDAQRHFQDEMSRGLTATIMRHQSFGSMMNSIGDQIVSGMMQNAIKSILANDMTKESDAAAAARKAFNAGLHFPFPANLVMAPALGAMAFASVMAFEGGGIVPGVGRGDVVPAMLTPGEAVLPKNMTELLTNAARSGNTGGGPANHFHYRPTFHVQAIDRSGVQEMLDNHTHTFESHFHDSLRKMNRG